ncbi:hypothetical protein MLD38_020419 [Melastoma candidum]|uniref:Uncharacterized protein n=1 Tax=Melastoma candidum TaxID=119954 RepID=A0ACB9QGN7_9MYRT|nr:hypothetical protein MLD38_020419 [Melastoma candidum]
MEDGLSSLWGPVTSTDWCEKNYVHTSYVAEFFNTISNVPCIILALFGLVNAVSQHFEKRFSVLHLSNMTLAIGSMLYHATLQQVQQQGDETPMVWEMLLYIYILHSPDWHYRSTMPMFLFIYGAGFAVLHSLVRFGVGFKFHYAILCLLCIPRMYKYYIYTEEKSAKRLANLYVATIVLASSCWLFDKLLCRKVSLWSINPQGHALWHVLMGTPTRFLTGFNSYFANTFLMFCRAKQLGWNPKVVLFAGVLPYVKTQKPKTR